MNPDIFTPIYWGLFFDDDPNIPSGVLEKEVVDKHVTFGFRTPMPMELLGKESVVVVDGYGNDGKNEALFVELDPDIQDYHSGGTDESRYHITLSTSKNGRPVDSAKLEVWSIDCPYVLKGRFGYFDVCDDGIARVVLRQS